jgi:hypothetical protein
MIEEAVCRLAYKEPRYNSDRTVRKGLHEVHVTIDYQGVLYPLNADGPHGLALVMLYEWASENAAGGWVRHNTSFMFERDSDAFAFTMRWQGTAVPFPL